MSKHFSLEQIDKRTRYDFRMGYPKRFHPPPSSHAHSHVSRSTVQSRANKGFRTTANVFADDCSQSSSVWNDFRRQTVAARSLLRNAWQQQQPEQTKPQTPAVARSVAESVRPTTHSSRMAPMSRGAESERKSACHSTSQNLPKVSKSL